MKAVLNLLAILLLLSGCVSPSPETANGNQSTSATAGQDDSSGEHENSNERPYSRELALEEEMILPQPTPSSSAEPEPATNTDPQDSSVAIVLYNTFTLQLVAMKSMDAAIGYARQYGIDSEQAGVARILSHGDIYFILAYGVYLTQTQAENASEELQQMGVPEPWIRRLGTIERLSREADELSPRP